MKKVHQITEGISLPYRADNVKRLGFEPFKMKTSSPLEGIQSGTCFVGGIQIVEGGKHYYCRLDQLDGFNPKKIPKPENVKVKIPSWVHETEGTCNFSSKKLNDLERHMYGVHSLMFLEHAYN